MFTLKVATYNIHKGFSAFNRRVVLHDLRERLHDLNADVVFLQEIQGAHKYHGNRHHNYPEQAQHEFIAADVWPHHAYGKNAVYEAGHHGNALLSRFPIVHCANHDISAHRFEHRGLLHCEIDVGKSTSLHCLCAHFGLFARGRRVQTHILVDYVRQHIPENTPLIIAGDFNDWRNKISHILADELGMQDVFHVFNGRPAQSFPAGMPLLRLDRIYIRGFQVLNSQVHEGEVWRKLSDHAALSALLTPSL